MRYGHKRYQQEVLDSIGLYLRRCKETKNPANAFREVTEQLWRKPSDYREVTGLPEGVAMPKDMPFVCLRVPTGGGKTVIAARSILVAKKELLDTEHPLVLWLVPTDAIRRQTAEALRDRENPLRQVVQDELGPVEILDVGEALYVTRATLDGGATIIVSTIQAFRVENTDGRKVYDTAGALEHHFDDIPSEARAAFENGFPCSLANVLRLRRPLVIVDEAHNARSSLSMAMLERFQPRCILEFTATPEVDAKENPSNVLHSVSAMELKAESMIKLPIVLDAQTGWKDVVGNAIAMRRRLESTAAQEEKDSGEHIRPIMLIQAEPRNQEHETLHVEAVKKALVEEFQLSEKEIAVHGDKWRDLEGVNLLDKNCPIRYVITQAALREGWDCPWAYVLCSLAEVRSSTAVEQILGRILRMPNVTPKGHDELNKAYAFVRSREFFIAAQALKDNLVKNSGFEEKEAAEFVMPLNPKQARLPLFEKEVGLTVKLDGSFRGEALSAVLKDKVQVGAGQVTLIGNFDEKQAKAIIKAAEKDEDKEVLETALETLSHAKVELLRRVPADDGVEFSVPELMLWENGNAIPVHESEALEGECKLPLPPKPEDIPTLAVAEDEGQTGILDIVDGRVVTRRLPELSGQLRLIEAEENWNEVKLITWLDRNIPHPFLPAMETLAYLNAVVTALQQQGKPLSLLVRSRFELRRSIEKRLEELQEKAKAEVFQTLLFSSEGSKKVRVEDAYSFHFSTGYPCRWPCPRSDEFQKHYYADVGELEDEGEEYRCAAYIDQLPEAKFWVRNLERREEFSFRLPLSSGWYFYPDFIVQLTDGRVMVIEYKGTHLVSKDEEKERIGELWEKSSSGKCLFLMVKGGTELQKISGKARSK